MSAEKGVQRRVTMSAEKGDHECREGDYECREGSAEKVALAMSRVHDIEIEVVQLKH